MTNYQENALWRRGILADEAIEMAEIETAMSEIRTALDDLTRRRHVITLRAAKRQRRREEKS